MAGQNFNASSFYETGKACPQCSGAKWVIVEGTDENRICPTCQGTGAQKVPYEVTYTGPNPDPNNSIINKNQDRTMDADEILDTPWESNPDYIQP